MDERPPAVVLPPAPDGGRRVTINGKRMGTAYTLFDVVEFLHAAGLPTHDMAVDDPELIEWRGGGPYDWSDGEGEGDNDGDSDSDSDGDGDSDG